MRGMGLLRGDCPVGGLKVAGYITPAAQYSAITGGTYTITGNSGQDNEQGTCTFKNGGQCDAWDYYNGKCDQSTATACADCDGCNRHPSPATRVPLRDAVASMDPQDVWQNFYDLTQIPRPSHHEEEMRNYRRSSARTWASNDRRRRGQRADPQAGQPGPGKSPRRNLQAHMDMVPQKALEGTHDFLTEPIDAYVDGEWVVADGRLGADDGSRRYHRHGYPAVEDAGARPNRSPVHRE